MPDSEAGATWNGGLAVVTGAGGFIGSHLVEALVEAGAKVRAMVRYTSRGDRGALAFLPEAMASEVEIVAGDLRDGESVANVVRDADTVFHLGAQIAIPYSYVNPRDFFETNVVGTLNVAQACRAGGTRRLVQTSTSEVYGTAQEIPITEDHPLVAQSPYAASKIGADHLVLSFQRSFELPATVVRPFNTYGPRQSERAVIPTIIAQALAGSVVRLGSLDPRRDMTFVGDTVRGFIAAAASDAAVGEVVQLGTGKDVSIGDLVEQVATLVGKELTVEHETLRVRPEQSEVMRLIASPAKMTAMTGWEPRTSLEEGLAAVVHWIETHPESYRAAAYAV